MTRRGDGDGFGGKSARKTTRIVAASMDTRLIMSAETSGETAVAEAVADAEGKVIGMRRNMLQMLLTRLLLLHLLILIRGRRVQSRIIMLMKMSAAVSILYPAVWRHGRRSSIDAAVHSIGAATAAAHLGVVIRRR